MKKLKVLLIFCIVSSFVFSTNSFAACEDNPRDCFEFEDDGTVKTKDGKAERTFSFPPMKAGFILDFNYEGGRDISPHISFEVKSFEVRSEDFTFDVGVASGRVITSLVWEAIPIVKIGPTVWVGYNVRDDAVTGGIGFSALNF